MAANSVYAAAEIAAEFVFEYMEQEMGAEMEDCIAPACEVYKRITGEELDVEGVLGVEPYDEEDNDY